VSAILQWTFGLTIIFVPLKLALALVSGPLTTLGLAVIYDRIAPRRAVEPAPQLAA
jgi:hypothetical protein